MNSSCGCPATVMLERLAWDSSHYGFPVARLGGDLRDALQVGARLREAREQGIKLVYARTDETLRFDKRLLEAHGGRRVGGHVIYGREVPKSPPPPGLHEGTVFEVYSDSPDDPDLVRLGIDAGLYSRFRTDRRLLEERCDALYAAWIRNSVTGEMADEVLVARVEGRLAALVTIQMEGNRRASIGLVATGKDFRRSGLARGILEFAHGRLAMLGASRVKVVTQTENLAACRLYERCGYQVVSIGHHYHFKFES